MEWPPAIHERRGTTRRSSPTPSVVLLQRGGKRLFQQVRVGLFNFFLKLRIEDGLKKRLGFTEVLHGDVFGALEVGALKDGPGQGSVMEIGFGQVRFREIGFSQVSHLQIGVRQPASL